MVIEAIKIIYPKYIILSVKTPDALRSAINILMEKLMKSKKKMLKKCWMNFVENTRFESVLITCSNVTFVLGPKLKLTISFVFLFKA